MAKEVRELSLIGLFGIIGAVLGSFSQVPYGAVIGLVIGMLAGFVLSQ